MHFEFGPKKELTCCGPIHLKSVIINQLLMSSTGPVHFRPELKIFEPVSRIQWICKS